jgi:hypothetical protein
LGKKKIKLTLSDEAEWEDYFLQESKKVLVIKAQIDTTDRKIDHLKWRVTQNNFDLDAFKKDTNALIELSVN